MSENDQSGQGQAQQPQLPDIDITKPETLIVRLAVLRQAIRQIDDELSAYATLMLKQMRDLEATKKKAEAEKTE